MQTRRFLSILTFLSLIIFLFNPSLVFASSNFTTDYNVIYSINENGLTHANIGIVLTNSTASYYPSSYKMQLGFDNITNVKASDLDGPVSVVLDKTDEGYNIIFTFDKKSIGLKSKLPINLSFDTDNIAHNSGRIWEINIPGIANPADFTTFNTRINVPASFGTPTFIKPLQANKSLSFSKEQLGKSGISIAFGEKQVYDFDLTYHIKNNNVFPTRTEIALPPDTNYQRIFIQDVSPRPENVIIDSDGNWLAEYSLSPLEKKDVLVKGTAEIMLVPKRSKLSSTQQSEYMKPTKYWQKDDQKIKNLANQLKTPAAIYQYVVSHLKYDFSRVTNDKGRVGGLVLNNPNSAACREFTDLFIALARAANIPAREVNGFAYTQNSKQRPLSLLKDVLHAWPEYYDSQKQAWIMVDPTWGNTTGGVDYFNVLDFNHFAFVIKGENDSYPIPAGGYKIDDKSTLKDVDVRFSSLELDKTQHVGIDTFINSTTAGLPITTNSKLINFGPGATNPQSFYISSKDLSPSDQMSDVLTIPPFGYRMVDSSFYTTNLLTNKQALFTMRFGDKVKSKKVLISPFFLNIWIVGGIIFGLLTIIILIIAGKSRRIRIFK